MCILSVYIDTPDIDNEFPKIHSMETVVDFSGESPAALLSLFCLLLYVIFWI